MQSKKDLPGGKEDHLIAQSKEELAFLKGDKVKNVLYTHIGKLFPENKKTIITVKSGDTIPTAFKTLIDHNILSAPIYDVKSHKYIGFIDMIDLLTLAINVLTETNNISAHELSQIKDSKFTNTTCSEISNISNRNPWKPVDTKTPVVDAISLMVRYNVHRIPVVDSTGELQTMFTQSHAISFISKHIASFEKLRSMPIGKLKLGYGNVISVKLNDKTLQAFKLMHDHQIGGVAVMDAEKELIGNISVSDLKEIGYNGSMISSLYQSVEEFVNQKKTKKAKEVLSVNPSTSFEEMIHLMVKEAIHRVYVVEPVSGVAIGVVSLSDILRAVQAQHVHHK